jgi:hypothetical protein
MLFAPLFQQHDDRGQSFYVASLEDLISSKRAAGSDVDLEDVRLLQRPNNDEDE